MLVIQNLIKRLDKHNNNKGAKYTKGNKWKIIYKKKFKSKSKAMSFEYILKKNKKKRLQIFKQNKWIFLYYYHLKKIILKK